MANQGDLTWVCEDKQGRLTKVWEGDGDNGRLLRVCEDWGEDEERWRKGMGEDEKEERDGRFGRVWDEDRVGSFQSRAALTVIVDAKHDFCFTIYKSWFFLKHVFFILASFLKAQGGCKRGNDISDWKMSDWKKVGLIALEKA